jgi:hypothetical protein
MQRDFPEAIHVRLRAKELRTPRAIRSKYVGSSPRQPPTRSMTPGRGGVAVLQCCSVAVLQCCSVGTGRGPNPVVRRRRSRRGGSVLDNDQSGEPAGCGQTRLAAIPQRAGGGKVSATNLCDRHGRCGGRVEGSMYAIPKRRDAVAPGLGGDPAAAPRLDWRLPRVSNSVPRWRVPSRFVPAFA